MSTKDSAVTHTPGPWSVGRKVARMVYAKNGTPICECDCMEEMEDMVGERKARIAAMELANAQLISAAPELLDALSNLLADYETINPKFCKNELTNAAHAAIAKALGVRP